MLTSYLPQVFSSAQSGLLRKSTFPRFNWASQMVRLEEFVYGTKAASNYTCNIEKLVERMYTASQKNDDLMEAIISTLSQAQLELFLGLGGMEDVSLFLTGSPPFSRLSLFFSTTTVVFILAST